MFAGHKNFTQQMQRQSNAEPAARTVSMNAAFVAFSCAAVLYALSWLSGCGSGPAPQARDGKKFSAASANARLVSEDKPASTMSGRKLTVEKMAQRAAISLQYSNEEYGVAFDAPKGYILKEGDLPEMDRGLGYLGSIPMHFSMPNGVRLVTIEPPVGVHIGSNFVNEFVTLSAQYGESEAACREFNIPPDLRGTPVTRTIDSLEFHGFAEATAASMHEYSGRYLHAFTNDTCYEVGYGVATVGMQGDAHLKHIDPIELLRRLDKILDSVRINPPDFERNSATD